MKFIAIFFLLFSTIANAAGVYRQPATKITYTDNNINYSVVNMIRTAITPYGTSHSLTVHLINNRAANWMPTAAIMVGTKYIDNVNGTVSVAYSPSPDFTVEGCQGVLIPIGTMCDVTVTFTPLAPYEIDGLVHQVDEAFLLISVDIYGNTIYSNPATIEGLEQ